MMNALLVVLSATGLHSLGEKAYDLAHSPEKRQELRRSVTYLGATLYVEGTLAAQDFKRFVTEIRVEKTKSSQNNSDEKNQE